MKQTLTGRQDRKGRGQKSREPTAPKAQYGWTIREIYHAADSFRKALEREPSSSMTFAWYLAEMHRSGLRPSQVTLRRGGYQLARIGDAGSYSEGNCRFISNQQNIAERTEGYQRTPEFRKLASELAKQRERLRCTCGGSFTPGMYSRWHGQRCRRKERQHVD